MILDITRINNNIYLLKKHSWVWNIDGGLNCYIGPGASIGFYSYDNDAAYLNLALGGQIGLEYDLTPSGTPILFSIDARPMWDFIGNNNGFGWGAALSIRYTW